jgi:hypothetical protein
VPESFRRGGSKPRKSLPMPLRCGTQPTATSCAVWDLTEIGVEKNTTLCFPFYRYY